jgi:hypothetical protein
MLDSQPSSVIGRGADLLKPLKGAFAPSVTGVFLILLCYVGSRVFVGKRVPQQGQ